MSHDYSAELKAKFKHYRISSSEFETIKTLLKREPKGVEWALFSALWSEHCSYKSSKIHLKKFAQTMNEKSLALSGENAGVVDLGLGEKIVFKMESHNHPSFIEPYQGAATGVGGILRDIFTMGARPIALADYLCFGEVNSERMPFLVDGVVRGISGYGNSVGVPTVTGQTQFDESYNNNILVNAMAVGLLAPQDKVALSGASGVGNHVVYVGAKTGKDGVHGAAMASESFDENSEAKKPNVQIGDPYFEKLLIESCLEVLKKDLVVAIQDMGAAGLTSSSFEMASKGQMGMKLHLDKVPLRDMSMTPEEILLSESQERMLLICEPRKFSELAAVFHHWGLDAVVVGELKTEKTVDLWWHGECVCSIDPDFLVENAPQYKRDYRSWQPTSKVSSEKDLLYPINNISSKVENYFATVAGASRGPIYRQYDQRVGLKTVRGAEHDVAILRLPDSGRALAVTVGCRTHLMKMDAQLGAYDSVFYPSFQMSLKGALPMAITDCLNFGNPERLEIMSEFVASVEAILDSSLKLRAPVVSGNVSFYNETLGKNITSTPATGLIGLRDDVDKIPEDFFQKVGSSVYLVGDAHVSSRGLWAQWQREKNLFAGDINSQKWAEQVVLFQQLSKQNGVLATQMVGRGGLLLSVLKMSESGFGIKFSLDLSDFELTKEVFYQGLFEVSEEFYPQFEAFANKLNIKIQKLGVVQQGFTQVNEMTLFSLAELKSLSERGLRGQIENLA